MSEQDPGSSPEQTEALTETELTFDNFWEQWGEQSGFGRRVLSRLWADAETQHIDLPYHDFQHVQETTWKAMELADLCEAHACPVNRRALLGAALFHDAGYHEALAASQSKEARSSDIFESRASKYGYKDDEVAVAKQAILSTARDIQPVSLEDKILVRADLSNVGGDFKKSFQPNTELLREECQRLYGHKPAQWAFALDSIRILADYLSNDLSLGEFDKRDWSKRATSNLFRLAEELAKHRGEEVSKFITALGSTAMNKLFEPLSKLKPGGNSE